MTATRARIGWAISFIGRCALGFVGCAPGPRDADNNRVADNERVKVLIPSSMLVDQEKVQNLITLVQTQPALRGIPTTRHPKGPITISLVAREWDNVDAWASPRDRTVVLPYPAVFTWPRDKLFRVIRHELAHILMAEFLGYAQSPFWLSEGFPEWEREGVSCEVDVRVRLHFLLGGEPHLKLDTLHGSSAAHDLAVTFIDFLDRRSNGGVRDGRLLRAIREQGVEGGLRSIFAAGVTALEREWHEEMTVKYRDLAVGVPCSGS